MFKAAQRQKYGIFSSILSARWHRIAYGVEGQSVTLYLDCIKLDTLDLLRGFDPHVSTEGVTVFGTRLLDEGVFEVRLLYVCCVQLKGHISLHGDVVQCNISFCSLEHEHRIYDHSDPTTIN